MFVYSWAPNSETHSLASSCWVSTSVPHICDCFLSALIQPLEDKNFESQSYCTPWPAMFLQSFMIVYMWELENQWKSILSQLDEMLCVSVFAQSSHIRVQEPLECRWKECAPAGLNHVACYNICWPNSNVSNQPFAPRRPWSIRHKPLVRSYGSGASRRPKSKPCRSVGHAHRVPSKTGVGIPVGWKRANCTTRSLPSLAWWYGASYMAR